MSLYTFNLHRDAGYVSIHQGLELKYKLPYGGSNPIIRGWVEHVLTQLLGKERAYGVLGTNVTIRGEIPDKKIWLLIPLLYHVSAKPSLWFRFKNCFTLWKEPPCTRYVQSTKKKHEPLKPARPKQPCVSTLTSQTPSKR